MCGLYVRFWSKVMPITFGCVAMGSAVLFILRSRHHEADRYYWRVGSWPSNRTTRDRLPSELDYTL